MNAPGSAAPEDDTPPAAVTPTKVDVLVVEDDADVRQMLGTALLFEGFNVQVATNGAEGLSYLRRKVPDLILLDLVLPWVNGIEVLAALRTEPHTEHVPVIVVTGTATQPHDLHGLGPIDIVHKPFDPDQLLSLIAAVLRRPRGHSRHVTLAHL
jgi:two-component system phosphate regulon response regulator PhoB